MQYICGNIYSTVETFHMTALVEKNGMNMLSSHHCKRCIRNTNLPIGHCGPLETSNTGDKIHELGGSHLRCKCVRLCGSVGLHMCVCECQLEWPGKAHIASPHTILHLKNWLIHWQALCWAFYTEVTADFVTLFNCCLI